MVRGRARGGKRSLCPPPPHELTTKALCQTPPHPQLPHLDPPPPRSPLPEPPPSNPPPQGPSAQFYWGGGRVQKRGDGPPVREIL